MSKPRVLRRTLLKSMAALAAVSSGPLVQTVAKAESVAEKSGYLWRPVKIGAGGFLTGYSADRSGTTRVVRSDVYGAYLWLDHQSRWAQLVNSSSMPPDMLHQDGANDGVYEIVVAPSDSNVIYMAIKGSVLRSKDRGRTFAKTSDLPGGPVSFDANSEYRFYGPFLAVDPALPSHVYFGTPANGLFRSMDSGETWATVSGVPVAQAFDKAPGRDRPGISIWFDATSGGSTGRLFVMSNGHGMFESCDGGESFHPLGNSADVQPRSITQGSFSANRTFFAVDLETRRAWSFRAGRWEDLTGRPGLGARRFVGVSFSAKGAQVLVFDEGGRPYRSRDDGRTWQRLLHKATMAPSDPQYLRVTDQTYWAMGRVELDPVVPDRLWVGAGTGVYFADVGPTSSFRIEWISQTSGIEELVANDVIKPSGQAPLFAASDFGIHRKAELDTYSTTFGPKERVLVSAQQLAWNALDPRFVVTNASDFRTNCCSEDGDSVLAGFSTDGGVTWSKFLSLPTPPGARGDDPWRMAFGTIAVSSGDSDNIVWMPSFDRSPYFTRDRGRTWSRVVLEGEKLPLTGSHATPWMQRKNLVADRVLTGVFYIAHSGGKDNVGLAGLWVTRNGGVLWKRVFVGEIAPDSQHAAKLRAVPGRAGHLFFTSGVYGGADTRLRASEDGGATWTVMASVTQVDDVAFGMPAANGGYPTIFVSGQVNGRYGIWRSLDRGESWKQIGKFAGGSLDQVTVMEGDPDVFGRVYLGFKGSGWMYGGPAGCAGSAYKFPADSECFGVI